MSTQPNKIIYSMVGVSRHYDKRAVVCFVVAFVFAVLAWYTSRARRRWLRNH